VIDRRVFLSSIALGLLATPLAAEAQRVAKVPKLGFLSHGSSEGAADSAFMRALRDLGWVDGRTIVIEARYTAGSLERTYELVRELIARDVDILVVWSPYAVAAAKKGTRTIPIVGLGTGDPVATGLVVSLAKPGANVTGLADLNKELHAQRLALLKETVPGIRRVAVLSNPAHLHVVESIEALTQAARSLALDVELLNVSAPAELAKVFGEISRRRADGLLVLPDIMFWARRTDIVGLAAKGRLPAIYWERAFAEVGGLLSYATDLTALAAHGATFAHKVLRGAKPANLPVEQPTKFELVINLKTAKALGLTIPRPLLQRADQVIE
jgi:putative tryptophan/tyrosine transport system substrate-binding protein